MDRAILGDRNGRENLGTFLLIKLRFLYLTGEVLEL